MYSAGVGRKGRIYASGLPRRAAAILENAKQQSNEPPKTKAATATK